jgi:protease I
MQDVSGRRILVFVGGDYEDLELWYPKLRLEEAGAAVTVAGPEAGATYPGKHGYPCSSDAAIADMSASDFDGVVIPGGWMPDKLRRDEHAKEIIRNLDQDGRLVATICHGPWVYQSAGLCRGRRMTSTPGIRDDLVYAGAEWVDEAVIVDRNLVTSRRPPDLPQFAHAMLEVLAGQAQGVGAK